ncbi:MAG: hypothetical protein ACKV19_08615 [Verrucomicrobiales bacterium]
MRHEKLRSPLYRLIIGLSTFIAPFAPGQIVYEDGAGLKAAIKPNLAINLVGPDTPNTFSNGSQVAGVKPAAYAGFESPVPAGKAEPRTKGKRKAEATAKPEAKPAAEETPADSRAEARKRPQAAKDAPTGTSDAAHALTAEPVPSTTKRPQIVAPPEKGERIVLLGNGLA